MTKNEFAKLFGFSIIKVNWFFSFAGQKNENIERKRRAGCQLKPANFTLEECDQALRYFDRFTEPMSLILKDNFIDHPGDFVDKRNPIKLTQEELHFIYLYNHYHRIFTCCNTCQYCISNTINKAGSRPSPYCNLYGYFLRKKQVNVYKDHCESFELDREHWPVIWNKTVPSNYNPFTKQYTEAKILGFDKSVFKSKREPGEPITLLR